MAGVIGHTDASFAGGRTDEKSEEDSNGHLRTKKDNPFGDREGKELHVGKYPAKNKRNRRTFRSGLNAAEGALALGGR